MVAYTFTVKITKQNNVVLQHTYTYTYTYTYTHTYIYIYIYQAPVSMGNNLE